MRLSKVNVLTGKKKERKKTPKHFNMMQKISTEKGSNKKMRSSILQAHLVQLSQRLTLYIQRAFRKSNRKAITWRMYFPISQNFCHSINTMTIQVLHSDYLNVNTDGTNDFSLSFKSQKSLKQKLSYSNDTKLNTFLLDYTIAILFYTINIFDDGICYFFLLMLKTLSQLLKSLSMRRKIKIALRKCINLQLLNNTDKIHI